MELTGKARLAGVFGWPVSHSLSPRLHGFWLARHGIDGAYLPLPVAPEDFALALKALPKMGFVGGNVTVPHKEAALTLCDQVDDQAKRIGAVNTLVVQENGAVEGRNTDGLGFMANLRQAAPQWNPQDAPAVVLGAGGAARAVCVALLDAGAPSVIVVNRTRSKAAAICEDLDDPRLLTADWTDRENILEGAGTLVNTTVLGMTGKPPLALALDSLPPTALVNDIVYAPLETDLLAAARKRGNMVVDGLGMLLHQAVPGFAAWFGVTPGVDAALRNHVLKV